MKFDLLTYDPAIHKKKRLSQSSSFTSFRIYFPTRKANFSEYCKKNVNSNIKRANKLKFYKYQARSGNADRYKRIKVVKCQFEGQLL